MKKPILFFAFANDQEAPKNYLRNLPNELRTIKAVLQEAKKTNLCTIEERSNATIDEIFDTFQDNQMVNKIAFFHFAGHADSYRLLLESDNLKQSSAHAKGLVSFLGRQEGLKLVFLNGCSTKQYALDLIEAGVPAVIGTSGRINDETAKTLAVRFYNGIGQGASIEKAWGDAKDQINTIGGDVYRDISSFNMDTDEVSWEMYIRDGAEQVKMWNLPEAAGNPLFGLPQLPDNYYPSKEPFRYLNRFKKEDAKLFFGRGVMIRKLYEQITSSKSEPIVLLHGQSGVGKSSLLEAGLFPRLESSCKIKFLRRDAAKGLVNELIEELEITNDQSLKQNWLAYEKKHGQPLHIVLDQVEEIFTQPNESQPDELLQLCHMLKETFFHKKDSPKGKLILSYRKEFHSDINAILKKEELPRSNFFVERLNRNGIIEIVKGLESTPSLRDKYKLKVEESLPEIIAADLLGDRISAVAPVLQILLTKMWNANPKPPGKSKFTISLYQELKKDGGVLSDFLEERLDDLKKWDKEAVQSGLALNLLAFHTTDKGTARQRNDQDILKHYPDQSQRINTMIQKMKECYLLTDIGASIPTVTLAHDTLAVIIKDKFEKSDQPGSRALRVLKNKTKELDTTQSSILLTRNELEILEEGKSGMRKWNEEEVQLIQTCKSHYQKLDRQKQVKNYAILALLFIGLISGFFFFKNNLENQNLKITAESDRLFGEGLDLVATNPTLALEKMRAAWRIKKSQTKTRLICKLYQENLFYDTLFADKNGLINRIAFNPKRNVFAYAKNDESTVYLYPLDGLDTTVVDSLGKPGNDISALLFSEDGNFLVAGSTDRKTHVWNLNTKIHREFPNTIESKLGHADVVCISPDSNRIASGHDDTLRIWNRISGKLINTIPVGVSINFLSFDEDNRSIWIGSRESKLMLLTDDSTLSQEHLIEDAPVDNIQRIGSSDKLFQITKNKAWIWPSNVISQAKAIGEMTNYQINYTKAICSADGKFILTASDDKIVRLWDANDQSLLHTLIGHEQAIEELAFDEKNNTIFTASSSTILKWQIPQYLPEYTLREEEHRIETIDVSTDGKKLVAGTVKPSVDTWDLVFKKSDASVVANNDTKSITAITLADNDATFFTGNAGGLFQQWTMGASDGKTIHQFGEKIDIEALAAKGEHVLIACENDNDAYLWKMNSNTPTKLEGHQRNVLCLSLAADAKSGLTGASDSLVILWDLPSGKKTNTFFHKHGEVRALAFFDEGRSFLSLGKNSYVYQWGLESDDLQIRKLPEDKIRFLLADPGSNFYVTASRSKIQIWHWEGALLREYKMTDDDKISALALSADGQWIYSGNRNGKIHAWKVDRLPEFLFE